MKVMVIGATGFIGPRLVEAVRGLGHEPLGVSRRGSLAADRGDPVALAALAEAQGVDAVVDLLAMTLETTAPLLDALSGRVGRYVLASSGDVYRQYGALQRKEPGGAAAPQLAEDAPLRARPCPYRGDTPRAADDPQAWMDAYDKIPIEAAVAERLGAAGVTVRLPMVYGPGDRQRRFAWAIAPMAAERPVLEVDAAWAAWRTSYGYVDDVAHGLALAAIHPQAGGGTYNLGPAEAPDHLAWAHRIAGALGWTGEIRTIARTGASPLDRLDLSYPMVTDTGRVRAELGYAEPTDPEEALSRTIADELGRTTA